MGKSELPSRVKELHPESVQAAKKLLDQYKNWRKVLSAAILAFYEMPEEKRNEFFLRLARTNEYRIERVRQLVDELYEEFFLVKHTPDLKNKFLQMADNVKKEDCV